MLTLRPMTQAELDAMMPALKREYAEDELRAGRGTAESVHAKVEELFATLLPQGAGTPGQLLFLGVADGAVVGHIWLALPGEKRDQAWVYDVQVDPAHRRRGHGRALMLAAEEELKRRGVAKLGLNVFGHNPGARALYEELGYQTMSIQMSKELA
ncbi:GNAT family N-acetyltransferase [Dactylosporangium salmoneum]|uniref:N-acetyltransferase domain-containing protein n=1 Tax=Dactylosporangium salmoneum TaxID=53361 RepID=A0ABN3HJJ3_9ACTN